jgi:hypothetical protein
VSDRMEQFENELAQMRPRAASPEWSRRIGSRLAAQRRADRRLMGVMSLGALAACFIVAMLIGQSPTTAQSGAAQDSPAVVVTSRIPRLGGELQAFALTSETEIWK